MENCTNTGAKVVVLLRANFCTNCYYNFNPCGIFENMTSFTPIFNQELEQGKLMAALNSRKNTRQGGGGGLLEALPIMHCE